MSLVYKFFITLYVLLYLMLYIVSGWKRSPGINLKELTYWSYLVYYPPNPTILHMPFHLKEKKKKRTNSLGIEYVYVYLNTCK